MTSRPLTGVSSPGVMAIAAAVFVLMVLIVSAAPALLAVLAFTGLAAGVGVGVICPHGPIRR